MHGVNIQEELKEESEESSSILCPQLPSSHLQSQLIAYFFQETVN